PLLHFEQCSCAGVDDGVAFGCGETVGSHRAFVRLTGVEEHMKRRSSLSLSWIVVVVLAGLTGCVGGSGGPSVKNPPSGTAQALTAEEAETTDDATESVDEVSGF